jgi:hypothetical protein
MTIKRYLADLRRARSVFASRSEAMTRKLAASSPSGEAAFHANGQSTLLMTILAADGSATYADLQTAEGYAPICENDCAQETVRQLETGEAK